MKSFLRLMKEERALKIFKVFSHDATSIPDRIKEVNHGETCVLFFYSFVLFFLSFPLGGRAHARGLFSLCVLERDFFSLFFAVSKVSRSRAPFSWDRATR